MSHRRNDASVLCEVVKFTTSCTGCCEIGDYGGHFIDYKWDAKSRCHIGIGCRECGFTGKRRETLYIPLEELGVTHATAVRPKAGGCRR